MLTNIPSWLRGPLLNWVELGRLKATKALSERTEWERQFDEAWESDKTATIKSLGRSGVPSDLRQKVKNVLFWIEKF